LRARHDATLEDRTTSEAEAEVGVPVEDTLPARTLILAEAADRCPLATVIGYARLFADNVPRPHRPRRRSASRGHRPASDRPGPFLSTVAHLALLPIVLAVGPLLGDKAYFLPTGLTIETVGDDRRGWKISWTFRPVPAAPGFIAVAMVTAWVVALASDSLAFRRMPPSKPSPRPPGCSVHPGRARTPTTSALLFVVAVLLFVLASRVARADGTGRCHRAGRRSAASGPDAARQAGRSRRCRPRLPGGDGRPLVDLDGGGAATTV
jgi:hypothetical protein